MNARTVGLEGEKKARAFLESSGLKVLATNFHSRFGEIDIVAESEEALHFIEVKASMTYDAVVRITPNKYTKILKTIDYYLYRYPQNKDFQVDAIIVFKDEIEWIKNISY